MKKLHLILLYLTVAFSAMAQTIGEAFYIYRNDGQFNAFFRDEVDSIAYSHYDTDSIFYDEIVTQLVYTPDSLYRIPLAVIDSIGFVQPETKYRQDAIQLTDDLFDYVISVDSMDVMFAANTPAELLPKVGDKIATVELTDKFPGGFSGRVLSVSTNDDGTVRVSCEMIDLEECMERFYGVVEIVAQQNGGQVRRYLRKAKQKNLVGTFRLPIEEVHVKYNVAGTVVELDEDFASFSVSEDVSFDIVPVVTGKVISVIDDNIFLTGIRSYMEVHLEAEVTADLDIDIAGSLVEGLKLPLISGDYPLYGVPIYVELGPRVEFGGQLMLGTSVHAYFKNVTDIKFYPATVGVAAVAPAALSFNKATSRFIDQKLDFNIDRLSYTGTIKLEDYFRLGVSFPKHDIAWVGGEALIGNKLESNFNIDFNELKAADKSTLLYETLKDNGILTAEKYWSVKGVVSGLDDALMWSVGSDHPYGEKWERGLLPLFGNTEVSNTPGHSNSLDASVGQQRDCFLPLTVGSTIYDEEGNQVGQTRYNSEKFKLVKDMPSYSTTFSNLEFDKKYKVYPVLQLFGYDVLASPGAELKTKPFPVTLSDFKVTKSQYKKGGFHNDGIDYDYCFNVSVTATLAEGEDVVDWGYIYRDPNGREKEISLMAHGNYYVDSDYAYYRNSPNASVCLYPYVKYADCSERLQLQPEENDVEYVDDGGELSCPDANHPHMIDLGLPSGTKWACCNLGASTPEGYGNYYAWGETQPKSVYNWDTYQYYNGNLNYPDCYIYIGSDIAGTSYDAATANWGAPWRMPSLTQIKELLNSCASTWTSQNGVDGRKFVGPNGGTIFLPAAGNRWRGELYNVGTYGNYWSSTPYESSAYRTYVLFFHSGNAHWNHSLRDYGLSVRPVR